MGAARLRDERQLLREDVIGPNHHRHRKERRRGIVLPIERWADNSADDAGECPDLKRQTAGCACRGEAPKAPSTDIKMPIVLRNVETCKLDWKAPAYHSVMQISNNPLYAGAYAFGRTARRTRIVDGRARKVRGFAKPREWQQTFLTVLSPRFGRKASGGASPEASEVYINFRFALLYGW